jgi:hypothetical protein
MRVVLTVPLAPRMLREMYTSNSWLSLDRYTRFRAHVDVPRHRLTIDTDVSPPPDVIARIRSNKALHASRDKNCVVGAGEREELVRSERVLVIGGITLSSSRQSSPTA